MANIMDYLDWRGDLTLAADPFNEVDNLLLSELCFLDLDGIVGDVEAGESVALADAVGEWLRRNEGRERMGVLVPSLIIPMAEKMAASRRFGGMCLSGYRAVLDTDSEVQFAALTVELGDGSLYIAFRGTDDTLVGWKEDFNMAFLPRIPSQALAVEYVKSVAGRYPGKRFCLGGHSKGGNLTVYAAVHCGKRLQRRLITAWSNDGPGFKEPLTGLPAYEAVREKIFCIIPQSSVVGLLMEHVEQYTVVKSGAQGLYQHDGFSWEVMGGAFIRLPSLSAEGRTNAAAIREFLGELSDEDRRQFVDAMFDILGSTNAQTLSDLEREGVRALSPMVRRYQELDKNSRRVLTKAVRLLIRAGGESLWESIEEKRQEIKKLLKIEKK